MPAFYDYYSIALSEYAKYQRWLRESASLCESIPQGVASEYGELCSRFRSAPTLDELRSSLSDRAKSRIKITPSGLFLFYWCGLRESNSHVEFGKLT